MTSPLLKRLLGTVLISLLLVACPGPSVIPDPTEPLSFVVDPQVIPSVATVAGLEDGDPPRPVAAMIDNEGLQSDFVLDELMIVAPSEADLSDLLTRWGGVVLDRLDLRGKGVTIFLVRVDLEGVDSSRLVDDLQMTDPSLRGQQRVSSAQALNLLAIAAREAAYYDAKVSFNLLPEEEAIIDGSTDEGQNGPSNYTPDAFQWPYMTLGSNQNIGVGSAWRLMAEDNVLTSTEISELVPMLILDNGFQMNNDIPSVRSIHHTKWDELEATHGTDVIVAAMGIPDNAYGAAGPAGPVARLTAVQRGGDAWSTLVRLFEIVSSSTKPQIINMSHTFTFTNIAASKREAYRLCFEEIYAMGHLMFAAAGNQGAEVDPDELRRVPCQLDVVVCVGGMGWNTTARAAGSNYGIGASTASVEIYGPFSVWSVENPLNANLTGARLISGTSFATPFVAGTAALVWRANPELTNQQVRQVLMDTAHTGGLGNEVTGFQRRINAFGAVSSALGYDAWPEPSISISATSATGSLSEGFPLGEEIWFEAQAVDHRGKTVPTVSWTIAGDTHETTPVPGGYHTIWTDSLPAGTHTITATVTDLSGVQATATITIAVIYSPPEVFIFTPKLSSLIWANEPLTLSGTALSRNTPLPDDQLAWRVIAGNETVHSAIGRTTVVPANQLPAGAYRIELTATDGVETTMRPLNINLTPKPPSYPTATIISPVSGSKHAVPSVGPGATISFAGAATDPEDGNLSGTYFRWTAEHTGGVIVLCEGNNFLGQVAPVKNCSSFTAALPVHQLGTGGVTFETDYTITLQVKDTDGNPDEAVVGITVLIPPTP